jgi:8-oxo-dGTP diphosphatase
MEKKIIKKFGNRLRIRVCGILVEKDRILLVKHRSLGDKGTLWAPPGGGMDYGTSAIQNLIREFREETGLFIRVGQFLFTHEFLRPPLHAVELFFEVKSMGGKLKKGKDPEMQKEEQIIEEVRFVPFVDLIKMDRSTLHQVLWDCDSYTDISGKSGYIKIE